MYQEYDSESGQYNLDCRLDAERTLDENVSVIAEFVYQQRREAVGDDPVKNRYEGYGLLVERFAGLQNAVKVVNNEIQNYQKILPISDVRAVDSASSIENALTNVITSALQMAAESKRVSDDMYNYASQHPEKTPLEEYAEGEGFQETEEQPENDQEAPSDDQNEDSIDEDDSDATQGDSGELENE